MAKNRTQLEEEAKELGIDASTFEKNSQFEEAIAAKKAEEADNGEGDIGGNGDRPVNTDDDLENPQDDQEDIEAPMEPEEGEGVTIKTTQVVRFQVNGETFEGTKFNVAPEVAEARKQLLIERYGAGVLEE